MHDIISEFFVSLGAIYREQKLIVAFKLTAEETLGRASEAA